jgi:hypothetical protein
MGVFDQAGIKASLVDDAKPIEQTDRLSVPGLYVCVVKSMKFSMSTNVKNKTDGWPMFNGEFTVLQNTAGIQQGASRSWGMLVDPGQSTSSRQSAERQIGDIKKFVAAAMGPKKAQDGKTPLKDESGRVVFWTWNDVKKSHLDTIETNPLKLEGRKFIVEVGAMKKSQQGNEFFPHDFRPYTEEEAARITSAPVTPKPVEQQAESKTLAAPAAPPVEDDNAEW